jgi:hypothetical protein
VLLKSSSKWAVLIFPFILYISEQRAAHDATLVLLYSTVCANGYFDKHGETVYSILSQGVPASDQN